ncbi:MAG TPA: hypothetical protein VEV61_11790 [Streptosporangiaceae bacterium]|nr:hypothetical protein [Streptosporangiaceae bacterium]
MKAQLTHLRRTSAMAIQRLAPVRLLREHGRSSQEESTGMKGQLTHLRRTSAMAIQRLAPVRLLREHGRSSQEESGGMNGQVAGLDLTAPERSAATVSPASATAAITPLPPTSQDPVPQEAGYQRPAEVADRLPVILRAQPRWAVSAGPAARFARQPRRHPLLALVVLALAVGVSVELPVVGVVTVAALLTLLTAGCRARTSLADRRSFRGPRLWDPALVVWSFPWVVTRSAVETVLLAPLLLAAAGDAVAGATVWLHGAHLPLPWPAVAAVYTALGCMGPWSHPARQQLHWVLDGFASSRLEVVATILVLGALAAIITVVALIQPPTMWPLPDPFTLHIRIPGINPVSLQG